MRKIGVLALALLTTLVWTYGVPAASWDYVYEGDKLPDAEGWDVFKAEMINDVCELTPDGELHITDPDDKVCFFMWALDNPFQVTYEARLKVLSQSGAGYTVDFALEDGALMTSVYLYPDHIEAAGISHDVDMTEYRTLRLTRDGDNIAVYVDDEKVIEGAPGGDSADRTGVSFGAGSTGGAAEHYWDYVAITTAGAFSPAELPSPGTVAAVEKTPESLVATWAAIKRTP